MQTNRRDFIRQIGALGGTGLLAASPLLSNALDLTVDADSFTVSILQTTDVHCQVHPHDELFWENNKAVFRKTGGYARLASYFKKERKANANTFIIDTGDMFQGSELSVKTTGKALVPILNALNYDLYLPGNWEVIYYKAAMQSLLGALQGPKLCANMYHDVNGQKGELIFPPYYIWEVNGVKIGFLGYTDPLVPLRQSPNYSKGIIYTQPEENLAQFTDLLRNQEKCAYVLIVAHLGLSQQIHLANQEACSGVDYILGGDTHERVRKPIKCRYAKVVEPGAFGSFVGKLTLTIKNKEVVADKYELIEITADKISPATEIDALIATNEKIFAQDIYALAGYSTIPLYRNFVIENPIDTLILNALHWKIPGADIVLSNGFRFCPPNTTPDHTGNIPISNGYIFDMLPVDSTIRMGTVNGRQIRDWLEKELNNVFAKEAAERFGGWMIKFQGMKIRFKAFAPKGYRVQEIMVGGQPLDDQKTYTICACERDGDPEDMLCRIKGVSHTNNTPYSLHQALKSYLAEHSPVTPIPPNNAIILDGPPGLLTQVTGIDYQFH